MAHGAEFVQGAGALRRASGHVQEAKSNLDRTRRNLESDVTAMTARWQGEGGRSFQNMMRVFVQHHDELTRLLDTFSSNMDTSDTDGTSALKAAHDAHADVEAPSWSRVPAPHAVHSAWSKKIGDYA